jgi:tRNA A-37 threonylcarbamoyl transferase component Bud32
VKSTLEVAGRAVEIAYKRTRAKNVAKLVGGWLRPDRALRGWCMGHALAIRGIATPRPLAVVRRGRLRPETWLATEWIAGGLDLHSYLWKLEVLEPRERDHQAIRTAEVLGRLLGRMHAWNVSHRDLKANNLLVAERAGALHAWLVDLDGAGILRHLSFDRRARDLARLAASMRRYRWLPRSAVRRFLHTYLRAMGHAQHEWQALWKATRRHAAQFRSAW